MLKLFFTAIPVGGISLYCNAHCAPCKVSGALIKYSTLFLTCPFALPRYSVSPEKRRAPMRPLPWTTATPAPLCSARLVSLPSAAIRRLPRQELQPQYLATNLYSGYLKIFLKTTLRHCGSVDLLCNRPLSLSACELGFSSLPLHLCSSAAIEYRYSLCLIFLCLIYHFLYWL